MAIFSLCLPHHRPIVLAVALSYSNFCPINETLLSRDCPSLIEGGKMEKTLQKRKIEESTASGSGGKKQQKRDQHFLKSYTKTYPCIVESKVGSTFARCTVCDFDFVISASGANDVGRHVKSARHTKKGAALVQSSKVTNFFDSVSSKDKCDEQDVIRAETLFTHFLVEHNIPLSASDHAGPLFRAMFPGNKIAESYACARTKTTEIVRTCGSQVSAGLADSMRNGPFVLGTDGSQEGEEKLFPIVVTVECDFQIHTELLSIPSCEGSATGENIFSIIDGELTKMNIQWSNCLCLVVDNANVMTGQHKGLIAFVRQKVAQVHLAGCVCHLLDLAVKKAVKQSSKFDLNDILRQMNWYLDKSTIRLQRFQALQEECHAPRHKLLQHVPTRWLSLGPALSRILEQWEPLQRFFQAECQTKQTSSRCSSLLKNLKDFFRRRTTKIYVSFYEAVLEMFEMTNKMLQAENSRIHLVKRDMEQLFRRLVNAFVKPSATHCLLFEVDFKSSYNIKADKDIFIGDKTRKLLEAGMEPKEKEAFFMNVKCFYKTACTYMVTNLNPAKEMLWKHAEVADIRLKMQKQQRNEDGPQWGSLAYFLQRFPCMLSSGSSVDDVQKQFQSYLSDTDLSAVLTLPTAADQWTRMSTLVDHNGAMQYDHLSKVMMRILLIPVSNCSCERIFSQVRKTKTDFRGSMGSKTLNAVLQMKSKSSKCFETPLPSDLLSRCKKATGMSTNK